MTDGIEAGEAPRPQATERMGMKIEYEHTPYRQEPSRGTGSTVEQREGEAFVRRTRGEHGRMIAHDYECPVHGRFEARVPSGAVPDEMPCPVDTGWHLAEGAPGEGLLVVGQQDPRARPLYCGLTSPWRPQQIAVGWSAGSVRS